MKLLTAIACLLVCSLAPGNASSRLEEHGQKLPVGRIVGTVVDAYDARIPHAKVRVESGKVKWEGKPMRQEILAPKFLLAHTGFI